MIFLRVIIGIIALVGLALLLGSTRKVEHPATHLYLWLGSIVALLLIGWWV
jgi:hypothetical protein